MREQLAHPTGALRPALLAATLIGAGLAGPAWAAECEAFAGAALAGEGTVTAAERVPAGTYTAPNGQTFPGLPAFCRIAATLRPSPDSDIKVEVWLPEGAAWNGRYNGTGNGGYAGSIVYSALAGGVQLGFATANTDQGTAPSTTTDARALIGRPQKWIDFAYRATHLMTVAAKQVVQTHYGRPQQYSYFTGCSNGGFQGFHEVQEFPEDYDGVLAGAPANNRTHSQSSLNWLYTLTRGPALIPRDKMELVTRSAVAACVTQGGGLPTDAYLTDPRACRWDPAAIQCAEGAADTSQCLSAEQANAVRLIYDGPRNPRTGRRIYTGLTRGSEAGHSIDWPVLERVPTAAAPNPPDEPLFNGPVQWALGPEWTWRDFDFDRQVDQIDQVLAELINANNPDLSRFQARGGKLLGYHGWSDALVPALDHVNYYLRVVEAQRRGRGGDGREGGNPDADPLIQGADGSHGGETNTLAAASGGAGRAALRRTQDFYRLFMVPGMGHCSTGPGPNQFGNTGPSAVPADPDNNALLALQRWVEQGVAPTRIIATKYVNDLPASGVQATRPLCPFPQVARYRGQGDPNDAASFGCVQGDDYETQAPAPEYLR